MKDDKGEKTDDQHETIAVITLKGLLSRYTYQEDGPKDRFFYSSNEQR
jgi:hypothetical protein